MRHTSSNHNNNINAIVGFRCLPLFLWILVGNVATAAFQFGPAVPPPARSASNHPYILGNAPRIMRTTKRQPHFATPPMNSDSEDGTSGTAVTDDTGKTIQTTRTELVSSLEESVNDLKRTLEREYANFFTPMEREYYAESVTFDDPLNNLEGIDSYEQNVNMLSGKNIMGKILFRDAGIVLHTVEGGEVVYVKDDETTTTNSNNNNDSTTRGKIRIQDIITRWTLRLTFQALPWQPTARFSGISVYNVGIGGPKGVQVLKQTDFWDSVNLIPSDNNKSGKMDQNRPAFGVDQYRQVSKTEALFDFLQQLAPAGNFAAPSAGTELPYQLLRRGNGYEVRRYPSFVAVQTEYERRDEGFLQLGSFASGSDGMNPLAPAIMTVASTRNTNPQQEQGTEKVMMWPLGYAAPGSLSPPASVIEKAQNKKEREGNVWDNCEIVIVPERVVAVGTFTDASVEPVVRATDAKLRQACQRDGLLVPSSSDEESSASKRDVTFAQYDAVFSMGERRGEVWIELKDGEHPWTL